MTISALSVPFWVDLTNDSKLDPLPEANTANLKLSENLGSDSKCGEIR